MSGSGRSGSSSGRMIGIWSGSCTGSAGVVVMADPYPPGLPVRATSPGGRHCVSLLMPSKNAMSSTSSPKNTTEAAENHTFTRHEDAVLS